MSTHTGSPVTVDPATCTSVAAAQRGAARTVAARGVAERSGPAGLSATFGVIGAEFLAALVRVADSRARSLDSVARTHAAVADRAVAARGAYECCDDRSAAALDVPADGIPA